MDSKVFFKKKEVRKAFTYILLMCTTLVFSQKIAYKDITLYGIGTIEIPSNMELQAGTYKEFSQKIVKEGVKLMGGEVSDNRIVFQPKGINDLTEDGLAMYARVIIETDILLPGSYDKLKDTSIPTKEELKNISVELKSEMEKMLYGTNLKIIEWIGVSMVKINGNNTLKFSYIRKLKSNPKVKVETYVFQNYDRIHRLTISYRVEDTTLWEPKMNRIVNSFKITNIK
ncbi:hypothetical protein [Myroides marinus]|uniref:hypothetical protein n=1 Tax=Myroides marinus TaxID=703342 RepID=UPI002578D58E|nr:hypothetical protein [Myroides marinus]MDM1346509.1 hypothetical protein [Myroides marinus]MDM1349928.1 hypothetical protein [Myroides marinus]MDM1357135.1 hypothetical protein [Myroides marinus]